jgi:tRNA nucleotidyltransferase/poly(A) polymerase
MKLVGGAVRVALNNEKTNDLDFAINIGPDLVKQKLENNAIKFKDKSKGHGTISIFLKDYAIEITSLRKDIKTFGRKAKVGFINSFEEDAKRRDFTINSIYSDLEGNLFDPFDGVKDLEKSEIRFIGNPTDRIKEDNLRLLRYFRFVGNYTSNEQQLHLKSLNACIENFSKIKTLSKERVQIEFNKLLLSKNVSFAFSILKKHNLLNFLINGLQIISNKSISSLNKLPKEKIIRIAFLIKETKIEIVDLNKNIKISKSNAVKLQNILSIKRLIKSEDEAKINKYYYGKEVALTNYKLNQFINKKKVNDKVLNVLKTWIAPRLPINGDDVIKYKKINGKEIGIVLSKIERWWVKNCFLPMRKECLKKLKSI